MNAFAVFKVCYSKCILYGPLAVTVVFALARGYSLKLRDLHVVSGCVYARMAGFKLTIFRVCDTDGRPDGQEFAVAGHGKLVWRRKKLKRKLKENVASLPWFE